MREFMQFRGYSMQIHAENSDFPCAKNGLRFVSYNLMGQ